MTAYVHHRVVRFGDCDPAGIVYFPVFFDWFHQAMESWFDDHLHEPYASFLTHHGLPAVHSECDWSVPCTLGERLALHLTVGAVGRTSLRLDIAVLGTAGVLRAKGHTRVVLMGTDPQATDYRQSVALPTALLDRIAPFRTT